jgi:hypothetical protein
MLCSDTKNLCYNKCIPSIGAVVDNVCSDLVSFSVQIRRNFVDYDPVITFVHNFYVVCITLLNAIVFDEHTVDHVSNSHPIDIQTLKFQKFSSVHMHS